MTKDEDEEDGPLFEQEELIQAALASAFGGIPPVSSLAAPRQGHASTRTADRYEILRELGRGGMGVVYRVLDEELGREVALKILHEDRLGLHLALHRFGDEARIAAQLEHPGIAPVYDSGLTDEGLPYFTMRIVEGQTLKELLPRWSSKERLAHGLPVLEDVCQAMAYAHTRGVIHRDLKPSNIMVGTFGEVLVVDWGLAKALKPGETPEATRVGPGIHAPRSGTPDLASISGSVVGTYGYMAPEQARGEASASHPRVDVYSLGAILFEILTGGHPLKDEADLAAAARSGDLKKARERLSAAQAPPELADLALRCLDAEPDLRLRDGAAVAEALSQFRTTQHDRMRLAELAAAEARARAAEERRVRVRSIALVLMVAMAALVIVGLWQHWEGERRRALVVLESEVQSALGVARQHLQLALASPVREATAAFARAAASLEQAEGVARSASDSGSLLEQTRSCRAAYEDAWAQQRRDAHMLEALESLGEELVQGQSPGRVDQQARQAFLDYGIDPLHADAGARVRESRLARELVDAVHLWVRLPMQSGVPGSDAWVAALGRMLDDADPDATRRRIRQAIYNRDAPVLLRLVDDSETLDSSPATLVLLADALTFQDAKVEAERLLLRGRRRFPDDADLNVRLGTHYLRTNRPKDAVPYLIAAESLRPTNRMIRGQLGEALAKGQHVSQAKEVLAQLTAAGEDYMSLRLAVFVAQGEGDFEKALAAADRMVEQLPEFAPAHYVRAMLLYRSDRRGDSAESFRRVLECGSSSSHLLASAAVCLVTMGHAKEALPHARAAAESSPSHSAAWITYLNAALQAGVLDEAVHAGERAVELVPAYFEARFMLALAHCRRGDFGFGEEALKACLDLAKSEEQKTRTEQVLAGCRADRRRQDEIESLLHNPDQREPREDKWRDYLQHARAFGLLALEDRLWSRLQEQHRSLAEKLRTEFPLP
jgi:serine/threonine-protein kinase